jgi:hypothetical protein
MELNHQIRLCRPFPFRFGFRALSHNVGIATTAKQALQEIRAEILRDHFMKSLPRKNP